MITMPPELTPPYYNCNNTDGHNDKAPEDLLYMFWTIPKVRADSNVNDGLQTTIGKFILVPTEDNQNGGEWVAWLPVSHHAFPRSVELQLSERVWG